MSEIKEQHSAEKIFDDEKIESKGTDMANNVQAR